VTDPGRHPFEGTIGVLLRRVAQRAGAALRRTPILLVSAVRPAGQVGEAARVGGRAHLPKPLVVEEFLAAVARLAGADPPTAAR